MNSFIQFLKGAKRYWASLVTATVCSFAVAALWGGNIGAFYPILEVTIRGKSVHQWFDEQITSLESRLATLDEQLLDIQAQRNEIVHSTQEVQSTPASPKTEELARQLDAVTYEKNDLSRQLSGYHRALPIVHQWVPEDPFTVIVLIVAILLVSTLVKHAFMIANDYLVGRVAVDLTRETRVRLFSKAVHLERAAFAKHGLSAFQSQISHSCDLLSQGLSATFGAAIREPLKLIACLIGAAIICPRLLLLSLIVAPVLGWILYAITRQIRSNTGRMIGRVTGFHGIMIESLANVQTIQAFGMQDHEVRRFEEATWATRKFRLKYILLAALTKPVIEFLGVGMLGTTIVAGAHLVLNRETQLFGITICSEPLSVSALLVFFGMLIGASDPLRRLSAVYGQIYAGIVAAESIHNLLDQPIAIRDPETPGSVPRHHRILSLCNVDFGYCPENRLLRGINLNIPFGTTVAIVGHNGSGKSTLINLLCRFYDPLSGSIKLDGVDYRDMRLDDIRSRIALVNQQTELFNETVAYNIRYGNPAASDEQVRAAACDAQASEFIETVLENDYQTRIGSNGQRLSGGQRQRIALARALLREPEILILDEATSQVDMHSEQLLRQALATHRGRRTMIIITHREKLLELADVVYEVRAGQLVQTSQANVHSTLQRDVA
ncbi:MAG: ATP-binding cassette domain-containing protein [Pirellulaceae bacterium]|nr:ATP-binding cassette domain-containing protein [Pirellulaceae bacterium]